MISNEIANPERVSWRPTGHYVYIETSRPRLEGDKARLLSPSFNTGSKSGDAYCLAFYYHMYGKHIGEWAWRRPASAASAGAASARLHVRSPFWPQER